MSDRLTPGETHVMSFSPDTRWISVKFTTKETGPWIVPFLGWAVVRAPSVLGIEYERQSIEMVIFNDNTGEPEPISSYLGETEYGAEGVSWSLCRSELEEIM